MLQVCSADGCTTRTLGPYCIVHERIAGASDDLNDVLSDAILREIYRPEPSADEPQVDPGV
jgi:hypothetical protein